ncbi:hypothetical protein LOAG_12025, partial [Loa loa]
NYLSLSFFFCIFFNLIIIYIILISFFIHHSSYYCQFEMMNMRTTDINIFNNCSSEYYHFCDMPSKCHLPPTPPSLHYHFISNFFPLSFIHLIFKVFPYKL